MTNPINFTLGDIRHDWTTEQVEALYDLSFNDLLFHAHSIHRKNFDPNQVQISTLLSIKTGTCPEDCAYCPQSAHFKTEIEKHQLMDVDEVIEKAKIAKANGATRFCMGAGWRSPPKKDFPQVVEMVKQIKTMGLETCLTLGMIDEDHAQELKSAGLDYYNHNLDTSPEYYKKIITTRTYQERLDTLENVRNAGINTCCGGIVGMGETLQDRHEFLIQLANLPEHPQSVPINLLVTVAGTPLGEQAALDPIEFIRVIALARIMMPKSFVRLSAGRNEMSDETQAISFFAGANSIHYGEKLLTTPLPDTSADKNLFEKLGISSFIPENYSE